MSDEGDEPTWGAHYADPRPNPPGWPAGGPGGYSGPQQHSFPVGSGPSEPIPTDNAAHGDYYGQTAQQFGTVPPASSPVGGPLPYPAAGAQLPGGYGPPYGNHMPSGESPVIRLMERGVRGELFRQPWFHNVRRQSPDNFVFISYAAGVVVTILVLLIPSAILSTLVTDALWVVLGYLYVALGTRLAHQFLEFGICVAGTAVLLTQIWSTVSLLSINRAIAPYFSNYVDPTGVLVMKLLIDVALVAFLIYVGVQVHRGIARLTQP